MYSSLSLVNSYSFIKFSSQPLIKTEMSVSELVPLISLIALKVFERLTPSSSNDSTLLKSINPSKDSLVVNILFNVVGKASFISTDSSTLLKILSISFPISYK